MPLPESFEDYYAESAQGRKVKARLRHPNPDGAEPTTPWFFRATDADIAEHVNNAAYWEPLEELLATRAEPQRFDAEIEFREPAQPGPALVLHGENGALWITAGDGRIHASIAFPDAATFVQVVLFGLVSTSTVVLMGVVAFQATEVAPAVPTLPRASTGEMRVPDAL